MNQISALIHTPKVSHMVSRICLVIFLAYKKKKKVHGESSIFGSGVVLGLWRGFTKKKKSSYLWSVSSGLQFEAITAKLLSKSWITRQQSQRPPPCSLCGVRVQNYCCAAYPLQLLSVACFIKSRRVSSIWLSNS